MRSAEEFDAAQRLIAAGVNDCDRGVRSIRYHFSNRSEDIIGLFTAALDRLGIHWTRSTKYIVSIYRKADTARLDEFIGPKTRAVPLEGVHYAA